MYDEIKLRNALHRRRIVAFHAVRGVEAYLCDHRAFRRQQRAIQDGSKFVAEILHRVTVYVRLDQEEEPKFLMILPTAAASVTARTREYPVLFGADYAFPLAGGPLRWDRTGCAQHKHTSSACRANAVCVPVIARARASRACV